MLKVLVYQKPAHCRNTWETLYCRQVLTLFQCLPPFETDQKWFLFRQQKKWISIHKHFKKDTLVIDFWDLSSLTRIEPKSQTAEPKPLDNCRWIIASICCWLGCPKAVSLEVFTQILCWLVNTYMGWWMRQECPALQNNLWKTIAWFFSSWWS